MASNSIINFPFLVSEGDVPGSFQFEYIRIEQGNRPLPWGERAHWIPAVDVYGNEEKVVIEIHIPGVSTSEVDIEFDKNSVRVAGGRKDVDVPGRREYFHVEISRGLFQRIISLPEGLDTNKPEIAFEFGVLKITLPWISKEWAVACRKVRYPEEWS